MAADQLATEFETLDNQLAELWRLYQEMQRPPLRFPPDPAEREATPQDGEAA